MFKLTPFAEKYKDRLNWHCVLAAPESRGIIEELLDDIASDRKTVIDQYIPDYQYNYNSHEIILDMIHKNPAAADIVLSWPEKISIYSFCRNPAPEAIEYFRAAPAKIYWSSISENAAAINLILSEPDWQYKIYWRAFSQNTAPEAIDILSAEIRAGRYYDELNPAQSNIVKKNNTLPNLLKVAQNPAAPRDLLEHILQINRGYLKHICLNPSAAAEEIIRANWNEVSKKYMDILLERPEFWPECAPDGNLTQKQIEHLCKNPAAIDFITQISPKRINWLSFSQNPAIFEARLNFKNAAAED